MIVSNLLPRVPSFLGGQVAQPAERPAPPADKPLVPSPAAVTARLKELLAGYDVRQISPREFSQLAQGLHEAGEVSDAEFHTLGRIRLELDLANVNPDERIDLVDVFQKKLTGLEEKLRDVEERVAKAGGVPPDRDAYLRVTRQQLDLLRRFVTAQTAGPQSTFDALA